jgi:hypothetical protein
VNGRVHPQRIRQEPRKRDLPDDLLRRTVQDNVSYGSLDTAMWVAASENVRVIGNEMYGSPIGFEITVANNVHGTHNDITTTPWASACSIPTAAGNAQRPVMELGDRHNNVCDNNLPNAPRRSFRSGLPPGIRILLRRLQPCDREEHGREQRLRRDRGPRLVHRRHQPAPQLHGQVTAGGSCREQQSGLPEQGDGNGGKPPR